MISTQSKSNFSIIFQVFAMFFIATVAIGVYFVRHGMEWLIPSIFMIGLYLFVIVSGVKQLIMKLPMVILMILAPIGPLVILLFIISLIPILEYVR